MSAARPAADSADIAPVEYLCRLGQAGEGPHDIAMAALMLSALDRPDVKLVPFRAHLAEIALTARTQAEYARDAEIGARALATVIAGRYGYEGERIDYDDPANADLMTVIERRRGMPVALGILYIHAARAAGMDASGLLAPGHFLLRVAVKGHDMLVDPFNSGAVFDSERVASHPLFTEPGEAAGLNPLQPVSDIDVLLRLQNNIKSRALQRRNTQRAIELARRMALIAPRRAVLWLELGRLEESMGALSAARNAYERGLETSQTGDALHNEAAHALTALKRRLN